MRFLPYEDFEIYTSLTSDEVFHRLRAAVDTQRKWWIFTNKPFWGEVDRHYFKVWRATWWLRNLTPVVLGKIRSEGSGCCIQIRMRLPWYSFFFSALWLGMVWYLYFGAIAYLLIQKIQTGIWQIDSPWFLLTGIGMFAFGYLLFFSSFKRDANRNKAFLLDLSNSKENDITYRDRIFGLTESQIITSLFLITFVASLGWIVFSLIQ